MKLYRRVRSADRCRTAGAVVSAPVIRASLEWTESTVTRGQCSRRRAGHVSGPGVVARTAANGGPASRPARGTPGRRSPSGNGRTVRVNSVRGRRARRTSAADDDEWNVQPPWRDGSSSRGHRTTAPPCGPSLGWRTAMTRARLPWTAAVSMSDGVVRRRYAPDGRRVLGLRSALRHVRLARVAKLPRRVSPVG